MDLPKKLLGWLHITNYVAIFALIVVNIVLGFCLYKTILEVSDLREEHRGVITYVRLLREEAAVREVVVEKLPSLNIDQQAKIAFEIYDGAKRNSIPSWLILAIIDQESGWRPDVTSKAGAAGLMQLMPATGIAYARMNNIRLATLDDLRDPVINIRLCIQVLADNYAASVLSGKSPKGDYTRALWLYNGRGEEYARKVMEKAPQYQRRMENV